MYVCGGWLYISSEPQFPHEDAKEGQMIFANTTGYIKKKEECLHFDCRKILSLSSKSIRYPSKDSLEQIISAEIEETN